MRIRVFADAPLEPGRRVVLDSEESHYLLRVRRARRGEALEVMDGQEAIHRAVLLDADPRRALLELGARIAVPDPPPVTVGLVLPEPKAALEAMTLASETGAAGVVFLSSERSHSTAPSAGRVQRVVRAAMRQCGRPRPLASTGPIPLSSWLAQHDDRPAFVASTADRQKPGSELEPAPQRGARLLVGPEGGLSPSELQAAVQAGFQPVSLGPWILRTPTAVAAGVAALLRR